MEGTYIGSVMQQAAPRMPPRAMCGFATGSLRVGSESGIDASMIRLSVGIESISDILADLDTGFRAANA